MTFENFPEEKMTVDELRKIGNVDIQEKTIDGYVHTELRFISFDGSIKLFKKIVQPKKWGDIPQKEKGDYEMRKLREEYMVLLDHQAIKNQQLLLDDMHKYQQKQKHFTNVEY
jgi:hypothetical protein